MLAESISRSAVGETGTYIKAQLNEACSLLYICISILLKHYPDISPYHRPQMEHEVPIKTMQA